MTDILPDAPAWCEEDLNRGMELLFFAYRDFTADPEAKLARLRFGRAHYRVVYFVGRNPGISVAQLLDVLRITKQSLSRVLSQLISLGYVEQRRDPGDGRKRRLHLTDTGLALERALSDHQRARVAAAYRDAGADAVEGFRRVMLGLINDSDRRRLESSL